MKKFQICVLAAVCLLFAPFRLLAQTSYGTVAGSVTDSSGAAVIGATVTITSIGTGETHTTKTNNSGGYIIKSVSTGSYNVAAEANGFSKSLVQGVDVTPSVTTSVNPVLKLGNLSETVEVSSETAILQTESGEISQDHLKQRGREPSD